MRAGAQAVLVEGLDPHAVGLEALGERLLALGEDEVEPQLGAGVADDLPGRLGEPDLLGERLPLEGGDHRAARLLGVRLQHPLLLGPGALAVDGQVDGEGAAQDAVLVAQRRDQQVEGVPGVGVVDGHDVGHPSPGLAGGGVEALVGDEPEQAPRVGLLDLLHELVDGRTPPLQLDPGLVAAGDRHDLELAVLAGDADRGNAEARQVSHAVRDELERVPQGPSDQPVGSDGWCRVSVSRDIMARSAPSRGRRPCYVRHHFCAGDARTGGRRSHLAVPPLDSGSWFTRRERARVATAASRRPSTRTTRDPRTRVASSASGRRARTSPSSPTSASTPCSTAARSRPGIAVSNGRQILVYKDMGLVSQVFDETTLGLAQGPPRHRARALLHDRRQHLGERPADVPPDRRRLDRAGPQRQPDQHPELSRMVDDLPSAADELDIHARDLETSTNDTGAGHRAAGRTTRTPPLEQRALEVLPQLRGRVLLRVDERGHPLRRPRPAGHPPAGARSPRARLGRRQRERRAGDHRRQRRPRGRARRADRHRRERPALAPLRRARRPRAASSSTSTSPGRTPPSPAAASTRPGSRWAASWPASTRSRPTW